MHRLEQESDTLDRVEQDGDHKMTNHTEFSREMHLRTVSSHLGKLVQQMDDVVPTMKEAYRLLTSQGISFAREDLPLIYQMRGYQA